MVVADGRFGQSGDWYRTLFWQTPADAGLDDSIFVDYGHFTLNGARVFSGIIAAGMEDAIRRVSLSEAGGRNSPAADAIEVVK